MIERLVDQHARGHKPDEPGVGFIYREDLPSAMEQEAGARHFTLALAGRAKNVAPLLADAVPLDGARRAARRRRRHGHLQHRLPAAESAVAGHRLGPARGAQGGRRDGAKLTAWPIGWSLRAGDMFVDPVPGTADVHPAVERAARLGRAGVPST